MRFRELLLYLSLATGLVHCSSYVGDYVLDDYGIINSPIYDEFWEFKWWSLKIRPVGSIAFATQIATIGRSTFASHSVNIAIHLLVMTGVACVLDLVTRHKASGWNREQRMTFVGGATLLWAVHPFTTTTVTYTVQRYESLAALGMIWSVYFWLAAYTRFAAEEGEPKEPVAVSPSSSPRFSFWVASLAAACFAFGAKETSAGLPIMLALADRAVLRESWAQSVRHWLGCALLMMPIVYGAYLRVPGLIRPDDREATAGFFLVGIDSSSYVLSQPIVYLRYLKLLLLPTDLVLDYGWVPSRFSSVLWLGALLWIAILAGVVWCWRRLPIAGWAITAALLTLATTSLVPTTDVIFEHRFYLPSAVIISLAAAAVVQYVNVTARTFAKGTLAIAVVLGVATLYRNLDFISVVNLIKVDISRQPDNPRTHFLLAGLDESRSKEKFERRVRRAIELSSERGYYYVGALYLYHRSYADFLYVEGRFDEAEPVYKIALEANHNARQESEIMMSLAVIASLAGKDAEASDWFRKAIALETSLQPRIEALYQTHLERLSEEQAARPSGSTP